MHVYIAELLRCTKRGDSRRFTGSPMGRVGAPCRAIGIPGASEAAMRRWHSSGWTAEVGGTQRSEKQDAPLRRIIERLYESGSIFEPDRVRLECGHEASSKAKRRVRCAACKE